MWNVISDPTGNWRLGELNFAKFTWEYNSSCGMHRTQFHKFVWQEHFSQSKNKNFGAELNINIKAVNVPIIEVADLND